MTTTISLTDVKSPFKAVAEYPPALPYVGQDNAYHRLRDFTQSLRAEEQAHFLALYGAWAIGKSRLGHELIAQFCGQSQGWTLTTGERAAALLTPLDEGGEVVPLFVSFVDVFTFQAREMESGTAMGKATCAATAYLAGNKRHDSHVRIFEALRSALTGAYPNFDFDRLTEISTNERFGYAERARQILDAFSDMTKGQVKRLLVIVDEVESGADIDPFAGDKEKVVNNRPIPPRAIRDLYSGVKDASNASAYPGINFLFFNTDTVRRLNRLDALERRMLEADLDKASATDLDRLLDALRQGGYPLHGMLEDLARRAFFAADRNLGWFSFIMNKAHYTLVQQPDLSVEAVFREVYTRTGKVFQPGVFENCDIQPAELKDAMRRVIYNQIPTTLADLGIDPRLRPEMLAYQDPFQTRFIGEAAIIDCTVDQLTRGLLATGRYTSEDQLTLTGEGSARFSPAAALDSLRTFAWKDSASDRAYLWVYTDPADFENQVGFAYSGFGADLSAPTARAMHKLLLERALAGSDGQLVAPTMALLRRFNDLWGKAAANDWLPEEIWSHVIRTIENSPERNETRLLQGIANVLFDNPQQMSPVPYPDIKAPSLTLRLDPSDFFNVTSANILILLRARETPQAIAEDLRAIRRRVPVLLVFSQSRQQEEWETYVRESHEGHLAVSVITYVVESQTRAWEFYVRYALRDVDGGFKADAVTLKGKELRNEFHDALRQQFKQWLASVERSGYVLRPFYPARSANTPAFREFARAWARLLPAGSLATLGADGASVFKGLEDFERERKDDTLQLTAGEGQNLHAWIPPIIPHLLETLRMRPRKMTELADDVFFIRSPRAVTFPSQGVGVLEQLLALLVEIGVVEQDAQSQYTARTAASFNKRFDEAFQRLGAQEGKLSGYAAEVASLSGPVQSLAGQIKVNQAQLSLLRSQELSPAKDKLSKLPLDRLGQLPPDRDAYVEVASSIGAISVTLDKVLGTLGAPLEPPAIDPRTVQDNIHLISDDKDYHDYSIHYRVAFLKRLQEYLASAETDLRGAIASRRASLESAAMVGAPAFPTRPLLTLLDAAQADLDGTLGALPLQLQQQPHDALLNTLKNAGKLSEVLLKLGWYTDQLDEQNATGWWAVYVAARERWQAARETFAHVSEAWGELKRYFDGTAPEHARLFTGPSLEADMQDLTEGVAGFSENFDGEAVSLAGLDEEIAAIQAKCDGLVERIQTARERAHAEIEQKLDESNDQVVRRLAERLKKTNVLPDRQRVLSARTHQEAHSALDAYLQGIKDMGVSLCERPELYDVYLRIAYDRGQGMSGEDIYSRYDKNVLDELSKRKLISVRYTVEL